MPSSKRVRQGPVDYEARHGSPVEASGYEVVHEQVGFQANRESNTGLSQDPRIKYDESELESRTQTRFH
jgi:hypothetical protein